MKKPDSSNNHSHFEYLKKKYQNDLFNGCLIL